MEDENQIKIQVITALQRFILFITSLFFWPLIAPFILVNETLRCILYWIVLPKRYEPTTDSAGGTYMTQHANGRMIVMALFSPCWEKEVDISAERELFTERVFKEISDGGNLVYGNFRKTFVQKWGYTSLRNDTDYFDVTNHVKYFDACLPRDGNVFTEKELSQVLLPHHLSKNMDDSKPQWEWLIIPRIQRNDGSLNSLRLFRWDHRYMDAACAGMLLAECVFDPWPGNCEVSPPYVVNPRLTPPGQNGLQVATSWPWAWIHLPAILVVAIIFRFMGLNQKRVTRDGTPFVAWDNKGLKSFSSTQSLELQLIRSEKQKVKNASFQTILATPLGPAMASSWQKSHPDQVLKVKTVGVAGMQALIPYKDLMVNQTSPTFANVPLGSCSRTRFQSMVYPYFCTVCQRFIGRLPSTFVNLLICPARTTAILVNVPFLRQVGSIRGSVIQEISSWNSLYCPVGLSITVVGYGETLFVTAFSVEECCSHAQLEDFVEDYISRF